MKMKKNGREKVYTIEGQKYRISDLYIKYVVQYGYDRGRSNIRKLIRDRINKDTKNHKKHILAKIIAE